jgi:hypothetical protein
MRMAKQDEFIRITLRLPPELHKKLTEAAGAGSMNAEIVARLEKSFEKMGADALGEMVILLIGAIHRETDDATRKRIIETFSDLIGN